MLLEKLEQAKKEFDINESGWLRYDFPSCDLKDQYNEYDIVCERLEEYGLQFIDVQIEHDCISGYLQDLYE